MNTASKTVVVQRARRVTDLREMLPRARRMFSKLFSDPRDIQLRELPDGTCEVVCYPDEREYKRLVVKGFVRGTDGAVVVASASSWISLGS